MQVNGETKQKQPSELIALLEKEMQQNLLQINLDKNEEDLISVQVVADWYINSEKLIRVIANIIGQPLHQSINQLRYAGHHLVAYSLSDKAHNADLIEAYKHCKRSTYDAFDTYLYSLSQRYFSVVPYLEPVVATSLGRELSKFIEESASYRTKADRRIEYYDELRSQIIPGLELIQKFNEEVSKTTLPALLASGKEKIIQELIAAQNNEAKLEANNNQLREEVEALASEQGKALGWRGITLGWVGIAVTVIVVALSAVVPFFTESKHKITLSGVSTKYSVEGRTTDTIPDTKTLPPKQEPHKENPINNQEKPLSTAEEESTPSQVLPDESGSQQPPSTSTSPKEPHGSAQ